METKGSFIKGLKSRYTLIGIAVCLVVAHLIYHLVFGHSVHFIDGDNTGEPIPGDYFGIVYKGGFIVPILMSLLLVSIVFSIERFITISKADRSDNIMPLLVNLKKEVKSDNIQQALQLCEEYGGTVGSIGHSALLKCEELRKEDSLSVEKKADILDREIDDAVELEMPALERNLPIISTIVSVATLIALLGTVLGMIKAFAGMAASGSPDASALSTGISEALINTSLGIGTSALAIISFNFFNTKIEKITTSASELTMGIRRMFVALERSGNE